jgi:aspartate aminotransferase-like enzyme
MTSLFIRTLEDAAAAGTSPDSAHPFGTFFLPGPTEVRREVLEAMLQPMLPHRGAEFEAMFARVVSSLQPIFRTTRPVYVSTSSATGFMEMAVRCAPPGPILSLVNGAFSERFADIARSCDRDVTVVEAPWGHVVSLDDVEAALKAKHYVALTVVHSETSTGALTALEPLAKLAHAHDTMVLVDSVTGIAGSPVETDAWELDVVLTGSQKALALPPGLAFAAVSDRFLAGAAKAPARGRYFDVLEFEQYARKHQTPNTPAVSLLFAAELQGAAIARETIEARWARHEAMRVATMEWMVRTRESLDLPMCIGALEGQRSATVTAIALPPGVAGDALVKAVAQRGFVIGGGYGKIKATSFRIGHMGDHTVPGLACCLDAVADALHSLKP